MLHAWRQATHGEGTIPRTAAVATFPPLSPIGDRTFRGETSRGFM